MTPAIFALNDRVQPLPLLRGRRAAYWRGKRRVSLRLPNVATSSSPARAFVCRHARRWGFPPEVIGDITLAAGEAVSNAIEHGCRGGAPESVVIVSLTWDGLTMGVRVRDTGPGFDPPAAYEPTTDNLLAERGRGLLLMQTLMDRVEHIRLPNGMEVRMKKRRPFGSAAAVDGCRPDPV